MKGMRKGECVFSEVLDSTNSVLPYTAFFYFVYLSSFSTFSLLFLKIKAILW